MHGSCCHRAPNALASTARVPCPLPGANYSSPDTGSAWGRQSPCRSPQYRVPVSTPQNQIVPWWILTVLFLFFFQSTRLWIRENIADARESAQFCLYELQQGLGTGGWDPEAKQWKLDGWQFLYGFVSVQFHAGLHKPASEQFFLTFNGTSRLGLMETTIHYRVEIWRVWSCSFAIRGRHSAHTNHFHLLQDQKLSRVQSSYKVLHMNQHMVRARKVAAKTI